MPIVTSAGSLLKEARARAGLTQGALAQRAGVTQSVISAYESGQRQPSVPVLLKLLRASGHLLDASLTTTTEPLPLSGVLGRRVRSKRTEIAATAAAHGVRSVRVFGSVARGTEGPESDIDLLVELPRGTGLFALGRLRRDLEELLGAPVDLVPEDALKPDVRAAVDVDLVVL